MVFIFSWNVSCWLREMVCSGSLDSCCSSCCSWLIISNNVGEALIFSTGGELDTAALLNFSVDK
jgi:hypothetical protein